MDKNTAQVTATSQKPFALYLEYQDRIKPLEERYRKLEEKFFKVFGFLPIAIDDQTFSDLTDIHQRACIAFWNNPHVKIARNQLLASRALAEVMFDTYSANLK